MRVKTREKHGNKRHLAFSLVEIMITMIIISIAGLVAISVLAGYINIFYRSDDMALARQRAIDAFNLLETPVLQAGLGIPTSSGDLFEISFKGKIGTPNFPLIDSPPPFASWKAAISIVSNSHSPTQDELRIVYSVQSGVMQIRTQDSQFTGKQGTLFLSEPVKNTMIYTSGNANNDTAHTYNWVTFPGQSAPMSITGDAGFKNIKVKITRPFINSSQRTEQLRVFTELLHIRALRAWVENETLIIQDVTQLGKGSTQEIPGVLRAHFKLDNAQRGLVIDLLTRGDSRDSTRLRTINQDFVSEWNLTEKEQEYIMDAFSMHWRVRNLERD